MVLLEVGHVYAGYDGAIILHGLSLEVRTGEIVSILGPNGAGKSTLLKVITGILMPTSGTVFYKGKEITKKNPWEKLRMGIGHVPQSENVFPSLTVSENLEMGAYIRKDGYEDALNEVFELFPLLKKKKNSKARTLSGGEQKMLAIARALMVNPELLLVDEPSAKLSPKLVKSVYKKMKAIREKGTTLVIVEQNVRTALEFSDRAYIIVNGRNRLSSPAKDLLRQGNFAKLFLA